MKESPKPLGREAIRISEQDDPDQKWITHFRAVIHLSELMPVDKNELHRYGAQLSDRVRAELRRRITHRLYGKVQDDARKAWLACNETIRDCQYVPWEAMDRLREAFEPLLNAGHELTEDPTPRPDTGASGRTVNSA